MLSLNLTSRPNLRRTLAGNAASKTIFLFTSIQELRNNSDLRLGTEFDCNLQGLLDRGARPLVDINAFRNYTQFIVLLFLNKAHFY